MTTTSPELVTTGEHLAEARSSRGFSVEDVAHETRIPVSHLRALEEGDYARFDGVAYARSFLRLYGNYLGVDVTEGLAQLDDKRELSGNVNHYPFLEAPDKVRLASEMKAPRSRSVPLITVLLAMGLVLSLPIAFLVARHYAEAEQPEVTLRDESPETGDTLIQNSDPPAQEELEKIAKLPEGQLDRIRSQTAPEVRRAEIVEDESEETDQVENGETAAEEAVNLDASTTVE